MRTSRAYRSTERRLALFPALFSQQSSDFGFEVLGPGRGGDSICKHQGASHITLVVKGRPGSAEPSAVAPAMSRS